MKTAARFLTVLLAFGMFVPAHAQNHDSTKAHKAFLKHQHKLAKQRDKQAKKASKHWKKEHNVRH